MPTVYTIEGIIALAKTLRASKAVEGGRIIDDQCMTPLIEAVEVDGQLVMLRKIVENGVEKHGAGMVRVSTFVQALDGFSLDDQIRNAIKYFLDAGIQFRIYSDADASGSLPWNDPRLIREMIEAKIKRYRRVFRKVMLNQYRVATYMPEQLASVQAYLTAYIEKQQKGIPIDVLELRPYRTQTLTFRPGLTRLIEHLPNVCIVVVNDLSRLSRNQYLFAEIVRKFQTHNIRVIGSMESLDFLNAGDDDDDDKDDFGNELQAWFLSKMAEYRLREVLMGSMRGILESLQAGIPRGHMHWWLQKGEDRRAYPKPGADKAVLRIVELFVDERMGATTLAGQLTREGIPCPTESGVWTYDLVKAALTSRAIVGMECEFGLEFPIFPALVDENRWQQIKTRWEGRDKSHDWWQFVRKPDERHKSAHLGTGLAKCICHGSNAKNRGGAMCYKPDKDVEKQTFVCGSRFRKPEITHISLHAPNFWGFIDNLMAFDPRVFLFQDDVPTADVEALREQLLDTERRVLDAEADVRRRKEEIRPQVIDALAGIRVRPTSPDFERRLEETLQDWLSEESEATALARLEAKRDDQRTQINDYTPPEIVSSITERATRWVQMENWERNDLLLDTFEGWYFKRRDDSDLDLEMLMVRRDGRVLPPVPVITGKSKGNRIWRRLPDPADWIQSVILARHTRSAG